MSTAPNVLDARNEHQIVDHRSCRGRRAYPRRALGAGYLGRQRREIPVMNEIALYQRSPSKGDSHVPTSHVVMNAAEAGGGR